jgi:hypothetical protein
VEAALPIGNDTRWRGLLRLFAAPLTPIARGAGAVGAPSSRAFETGAYRWHRERLAHRASSSIPIHALGKRLPIAQVMLIPRVGTSRREVYLDSNSSPYTVVTGLARGEKFGEWMATA